MASTDFDVQIGSTKAKILRSEDGGYRRRTIRREVEQQLLSQSENPAMVSRADQRQLYQTSWAGGSRWWKPLLGANEADSYFRSDNFDAWSQPGKLVPRNKESGAVSSDLQQDALLAPGPDGEIFAIGDTSNVDATMADVYKWTPASDAFVQETGYSSGLGTTDRGQSMVYDHTDGYFYVLSRVDVLSRFNPTTSAQDKNWITSLSTTVSSRNIMHTRDGIVVWDGEVLYLLDKSGPTLDEIFDDGLGKEAFGGAGFPGVNSNILEQDQTRLAVSSPEGIYYVKNVNQGGSHIPWVFRVDKDATGTWIGNPIATLSPGTVALSIAFVLGSVVVTVTPDVAQLQQNNRSDPFEVQVLNISSQSGVSVAGSVLGNRDLDDSPYKILDHRGNLVYLSGFKRLYAWDLARGGIHTVHEWGEVPNLGGVYAASATALDSSDEEINLFLATHAEGASNVRYAIIKNDRYDDPDTVTNFGDDEDHYVLTSNYFDGGLPMERKELTKVQILHQELDDSGNGEDSNQEWTVQISADGGSFSDALVNSDANSTYASADLSGTTGRRFQYRLIYQTKDTERIPLEGLLVSFTTGEMITEWDLTLDGDELLNVDNEVQDEQDFYDSLVTLAGTSTITTLVDNMQEQAQETDTGTTINVRVQAVEISKTKPGESMIRVALREAA